MTGVPAEQPSGVLTMKLGPVGMIGAAICIAGIVVFFVVSMIIGLILIGTGLVLAIAGVLIAVRSSKKKALPAKATAAVGPETAGVSDKAPTKKSGKAALAVILGLLGAAAVAGIVLLLVLFVFGGGGGPEDTARKLMEAYGNKDYSTLSGLIDQDSFEGDKSMKIAFETGIKESVKPDNVTYTDLKFQTTESGDKATAKVIGGTATYDSNGKEISVDLSRENVNIDLELVKKDGKWLVLPSSLPRVIATGIISETDSLVPDLELQSVVIETSFSSIHDFIYQEPRPSGAEMKARVNELEPAVADFKKTADELKKSYNKVLELEGDHLKLFHDYAKAMIEYLDAFIHLNDHDLDSYRYISDTCMAMDSGQPVDVNAYNATITEKNAQGEQLNHVIDETETKVSDLRFELLMY